MTKIQSRRGLKPEAKWPFPSEKQPAPVQPIPVDIDPNEGPEYEDGPDEDGFKGPRPWNGYTSDEEVLRKTTVDTNWIQFGYDLP